MRIFSSTRRCSICFLNHGYVQILFTSLEQLIFAFPILDLISSVHLASFYFCQSFRYFASFDTTIISVNQHLLHSFIVFVQSFVWGVHTEVISSIRLCILCYWHCDLFSFLRINVSSCFHRIMRNAQLKGFIFLMSLGFFFLLGIRQCHYSFLLLLCCSSTCS